jgi:hypothetical protein
MIGKIKGIMESKQSKTESKSLLVCIYYLKIKIQFPLNYGFYYSNFPLHYHLLPHHHLHSHCLHHLAYCMILKDTKVFIAFQVKKCHKDLETEDV